MEELKEIIGRIPRIKKILLMLVGGALCFVILIAVIFCGWFQMIKEKDSNAEVQSAVPNFGTQIQTENSEENVPNFGTFFYVLNLDEKAVPLLDEQSYRLEEELSKYVSRNKLEEKGGAIIHVMIPEQNDKQLFFFCKFSSSGEIVQVVFDREKDVFITLKSYYTEEEILSEIWNGACPSDRDMQE